MLNWTKFTFSAWKQRWRNYSLGKLTDEQNELHSNSYVTTVGNIFDMVMRLWRSTRWSCTSRLCLSWKQFASRGSPSRKEGKKVDAGGAVSAKWHPQWDRQSSALSAPPPPWVHGGLKNRVKEGKNDSKGGVYFMLVDFRSMLHCLNLIRLGLSLRSNQGSATSLHWFVYRRASEIIK